MRNKLMMVVATALLISPALVFAQNIHDKNGYGDAGCGLGSMVFTKRDAASQILAATTNGTGTQTFGITSGTSNCTTDGLVNNNAEKEVFIAMNFDALNDEFAAGTGETSAALASLYGYETTEWNRIVKANYATKLSTASTPAELQAALDSIAIQ